MKDACMISRGYVVVYDTTAGWVQVSSKAEPKQPPEAVYGAARLQRRDPRLALG
jgi:hypothetical protein